MHVFWRDRIRVAWLMLLLGLAGCSRDGGTDGPAPPGPNPPPAGTLPPAAPGTAFSSRMGTVRFLTQATFGPTPADVDRLTNRSASQWFVAELAKPPSLHLEAFRVYDRLQADTDELTEFGAARTTFSFWSKAIAADDQLRQRMAFALSEIFVVSNGGGEVLTDIPHAVAYFEDLLIQNAFGNYRDLIERVTYAPAMGHYLTYLGNAKANPETGRMPDENYAREIMQLFSIGLIELNPDGTSRLGSDGQPIETYSNRDVTGLAKVFTGLTVGDLDGELDDIGPQNWSQPMLIVESDHSQAEKAFLGTTILPDTDAATSIALALDAIAAHPNVGPFIGRQLIQRFTTSNPSSDYVGRVAAAFDTGAYTLPDGTVIGTAERGDLSATLAAVLFDEAARSESSLSDVTFGKIREPILRFTSWARAFNAATVTPEVTFELWATEDSGVLAQHPYRAPSVFNFFRPGYVAPGSESGALGMTVPELQLVNASTTPGYANFMLYFISAQPADADTAELAEVFREEGVSIEPDRARSSFIPDYSAELELADQPNELVDHLAKKLTYDTLSPSVRTDIATVLQSLTAMPNPDDEFMVHTAIALVMTSPDYLVQR